MAAAPVFYQVPLYRAIAAHDSVDLTVIFASNAGIRAYSDEGFGHVQIAWDANLVDGYHHEFARNAGRNDPRSGFLSLRNWDVFWRILRGEFDVLWVHGYSYLTNWLAILAALLRRIPILLREEQTLLHARKWPKSWLRSVVLRLLFRRVFGLCIGSNNEAYFRHFGVIPERLFFAPYCVDNSDLQSRAAGLATRRDEVRASFGLPVDDTPVILFVGKLIDEKQPLLVLDAFARVRSRYRCSLLIVGEGELGPEMRCRVARSQIPDVRFAGFLNRSEIPAAFAASDVFVLASHHETWGIVVNEAMNFGLPVVVSDKVGCAPDLIRSGENGVEVPHEDVQALADAIEALVANEPLRSAMGARSRDLIDEWHVGLAAEGIVNACVEAIGGVRRATPV